MTEHSLVDVIVEAPDWDVVDLDALAERACGAALTGLGLVPEHFEIALLACDDDRIADLNAGFRAKAQPTNVLSWPADEIDLPLGQTPELPKPDPQGSPYELGDIAIAFQTCAREAADQNKPLEDHISHLLVHATLHLLGFDHINDPDAAHMEAIETRILATMGIPDPY
ncbi:rRNA maturation RNase YbeY [Nioella aestuarii]|uniref:rRNA maturation RNase YbeY n=1 Tax=Nioella aestuarii TaxID=1662864 RepID=UPI003D7FC24D